MKRIIGVNNHSVISGLALLTARVGIAALMLTHGIPKLLLLFSASPVQFPSVLGMSPELSLGLTVFAEVFCSVLILAGFATRLAAVPLIITMVIAITIIHGADPISMKEPALHYLLVYTVLLLAGSGRFSIDYLLNQKAVTSNYAGRTAQEQRLTVYQ